MTQIVTQTSKSPLANGAFPGRRIAFIQSSWHADIVDQARQAFLAEIGQLGFDADLIDQIAVPGAFEIPLHAQVLAKSGRYAAVVAAGLVVDGGLYRHDFVAQAVISGLMQVQLTTETPVFSVVLTPHHFRDSDPHEAFFRDHFRIKGQEAARTCSETLVSLARLAA